MEAMKALPDMIGTLQLKSPTALHRSVTCAQPLLFSPVSCRIQSIQKIDSEGQSGSFPRHMRIDQYDMATGLRTSQLPARNSSLLHFSQRPLSRVTGGTGWTICGNKRRNWSQ